MDNASDVTATTARRTRGSRALERPGSAGGAAAAAPPLLNTDAEAVATGGPAPSDSGKKTRAAKRKAAPEPGPADCAVCLEAITDADAKFVGPCKHIFHVQCAEQNFVVGKKTCCPCCRAEFQHAPGFVAMALAAARAPGVAPRAPAQRAARESTPEPPLEPTLMPDIPVVAGEAAAAAAGITAAGPDFVKASIITDVRTVSGTQSVTALIKMNFKDDDDAAPVTMAADFVLLADVSGSMSDAKIEAVRDALLKLSDMFNPQDRVALVAFNETAVQLTALSPLAQSACETAFRRSAMQLSASGGTSIVGAMRVANRILAARATRNPLAHVLLLTDGQDRMAMGCAEVARDREVVWTAMGFGADHDAELLADVAYRGKGTFSFVERTDLLDETMAAYTGHATRVLAADVRVRLVPQPGVTITSVRGPGQQTRLAGGAVEVALGHASVAATREILVTMSVTCPEASAAFDALVITATADGGRVATPPLTMAFAQDRAAATPEEMAQMHLALNRERMAVAALAVAEQLSRREVGTARSVIAAARSVLVGGAAARTPVENELDVLADSLQDAERARIVSYETGSRARAQYSLMSPSREGNMMTTPNQGASIGQDRMQSRKQG